MSKELAIMSEPHFGMKDMSYPAFSFSVCWGENLNYGALIILNSKEFSKVVKEADVYDMKYLKGSPCQIEVSDENVVSFVKILKT